MKVSFFHSSSFVKMSQMTSYFPAFKIHCNITLRLVGAKTTYWAHRAKDLTSSMTVHVQRNLTFIRPVLLASLNFTEFLSKPLLHWTFPIRGDISLATTHEMSLRIGKDQFNNVSLSQFLDLCSSNNLKI